MLERILARILVVFLIISMLPASFGEEYTETLMYQEVGEHEDINDDPKSLLFSRYANGIVDRNDYAYVENTIFDARDVVKLTLNKNYENKSTGIAIDGYKYGDAGIDLEKYKYLVISYYFEGKLPKPAYFKANYMRGKILTKAYGNQSEDTIVSDRWAYAIIDLSGVEEVFNPDADNHNLTQMHIRPYDGLSLGDLSGDEVMYISQLTFFTEKPEIAEHFAYMKGYDGGLFKPQGNMTRAEACTMVARLAAGSDELVPENMTTSFTDVTADTWYYKYITYVESLGYLKSYSGAFFPNQVITRAEFVEIVYNMGLLKDAGRNGTFTDVAEDHPRAFVIAAAGKAGLVNGYDNGDGTFCFKPDDTITRAEVVKVVNNAYGRSVTADKLSSDIGHAFSDVDESFWAFADICEATVSHVQNGNEWVYTIPEKEETNMNQIKTASKEQIIAWRTQTDERIEKILHTSNMEIPKGSMVYYISPDGNDTNDGQSPEKAWKTLERLKRAGIQAGSYVCFERGGLWRGQLSTKPGVTYTSYGEGEKPKIYASPMDGADASFWRETDTKNIWEFTKAAWKQDIGTLVFNHGEEHAVKCIIRTEADGSTYNNTTGEPFNSFADLTTDLHFYHDYKESGKLYLYSNVNPGERFSSIEFNIHNYIVSVGTNSNVTIDNLCLKYGGTIGVGAYTVKNLVVQNCELGWIGGSIQSEAGYGRNYAIRCGNAIQVYGGCDGFSATDNYIYQVYDAGITQQYTLNSDPEKIADQKNVTYARNVIEYCNYSIEYFLHGCVPENPSRMENFLIEDNFMWYAAEGFCEQRPNHNQGAHIKGWAGKNRNRAYNFSIRNNLMCFSKDLMIEIMSDLKNPDGSDSIPVLSGNNFVGSLGGRFGVLAMNDTVCHPYNEGLPAYTSKKSDGTDLFWFTGMNIDR